MWQSSWPVSLSVVGLTLWPNWLERWFATLSELSTQVQNPVGLLEPGRFRYINSDSNNAIYSFLGTAITIKKYWNPHQIKWTFTHYWFCGILLNKFSPFRYVAYLHVYKFTNMVVIYIFITPVIFLKRLSYLTGIAADELWWHRTNINAIQWT